MSAPAAIAGDFCTFRHVQGRKVLQIVIEVPAEAAGSVFATLGMPGSGAGIPVGIARLAVAPGPPAKPDEPKERRPFAELPYAQQAAIRCGEPDFQRFLADTHRAAFGEGPFASNASAAAEAVRKFCGVESRADIHDDPAEPMGSGYRWRSLEAEFFAWSRGRR